jgi:hypothetical protein
MDAFSRRQMLVATAAGGLLTTTAIAQAQSTGAAHTCLTLDDVEPFVIGMPMQLAQSARVDLDHRRGRRRVDREIAGII